MDLDAVADELYGLRPEEFVAARDRRVRDARKAGDQALANEIGALRRPSLAAWVSNLLVRRQPEEVQPLLGLGEELRRAHRELNGTQLRRLARRRNEVIGALGRQARQLAAQAGHPVGEGVQREVEGTLHAALADPEAAREWAAGRLVKPLSSMIGFPAADEALLAHRPTPEPEQHARGGGREEEEDEGRQEATAREETAREAKAREETAREAKAQEAEERRRRLAEAREAERDLRAHEEEADTAARAVEEAGARLAGVEERVRELRERLRDAEQEQQRARAAERDARDRERRTGRAVREARRRAEKAAARLERPTTGAGSRG
ncbi:MULTISPECIES: hypothetical protein [Streptomyces]|uniref:Transposase n=1 Tax=Streptomyces canarius TaxID=285453 RepID=A0ABQ3CMT2_9ACTN|nr:hypothetical protein [Streptomyces canarius]GHA30529.1 hypothetical protein GCM10010345_39200 [Streptomyces canarius]